MYTHTNPGVPNLLAGHGQHVFPLLDTGLALLKFFPVNFVLTLQDTLLLFVVVPYRRAFFFQNREH
jgi:hypothetical protein